MILILIGFVIRLVSIATLAQKNYWKIEQPQRLVTTGIYKFIRHPMYLGGILLFIGLCLVLADIKITLLLNYLAIQWILDRIDREEHLLLYLFGDEYREYKLRTKMLIPFII